MKKQKKNNRISFKEFLLTFVFLGSIALVVSSSVLLSNHNDEITERSRVEATNKYEKAYSNVSNAVNEYSLVCSNYSGHLENFTDEIELKEFLFHFADNKDLGDKGCYRVRYFSNGGFYESESVPVIQDYVDLAEEYRKEEKQLTTYLGSQIINVSILGPEQGTILAYEFYSPVDSEFIDGVCFYFSTTMFNKTVGDCFTSEHLLNKDAILSVLATNDGTVLSGEEKQISSYNVYEGLDELGIHDKDTINSLRRMINDGESGTIICSILGEKHVLSLKTDKSEIRNLVIIELYKCDTLVKDTKDIIDAVMAILIIFIVVAVVCLVFFLNSHINLSKKVKDSEIYDLKLECLNQNGFEQEAKDILLRQNGLYFGIVVVQIRHFKYLTDTFGEEEVNKLLRHIKTACYKVNKIEEIYGYCEEGQFLMIVHAKDKAQLIERLKKHLFMCNQYKGSNKFNVGIKYGIYEHMPDDKTTISEMVSFAFEANNSITKAIASNIDLQFNFYNDNLRKIKLQNEDMELRQEQALKDGEFQIFYQAKYNLKEHKQDGAEALVRWYDKNTGEYNRPALFMPLFESNGFIEKLDKYVYSKVCEYISYSIQKGRKVFPVSVNVSRITAVQPDFVDYFASVKKKYGISNGTITVEFTESFAYENYDVLKEIVDKLHKNGFKVSIDDFGCGYSSYRILKELPMDEIKLDKFFIDHSEEPERVNYIFDSIISLAKNLNMKVTQEGVENPEDVELLKKHNCDVIQGYVYSKPLSVTDYLNFVENTKDHNL